MHICYIGDAKSIHVVKWAEYFARKDYRVSLISDRENKIDGVETFDIGECLLGVYISYLSATSQIYKKRIAIKKILRKIKPDIIHAHYATNYGFLAALSGYHPFMLTLHGSDILVDYSRNTLSKFFVNYAVKKADVVTSPSKTITQRVMALRTNGVHTIQYGVDTNKFCRSKDIVISDKEKTVISTRHLSDKYAVKTLIDATPLILNKIPDARFLIVGEGEKRHCFETEVKKTGYHERVEFLGAVPHEKMPDVLNKASIYVSTSPSDGLSISLLEAMACGLFPIVTDISGNREVIIDGTNGILFPAGDVGKLGESIISVLNNKESISSTLQKNQAIVEKEFSQEKNLARVESIYRKIYETGEGII